MDDELREAFAHLGGSAGEAQVARLRHRQSGITAGVDGGKGREVHVDVEREAMVRPPPRYPYAERRAGAPGVYVDGAKVAALGIRVTRGRAYHGLALNVDMDLAPFSAIDPCGYPGLKVTQLRDLGFSEDIQTVGKNLADKFLFRLEHA